MADKHDHKAKRPRSPVAAAVMVGKMAVGEIPNDKHLVSAGKDKEPAR